MGTGASKKEASLNLKGRIEKRGYKFQWEKDKVGNAPDPDRVMQIWNVYVDKSNISTFNLFTPLLVSDPNFREILELDTNPPEENMEFSRHLDLVHFSIDHCLKMIIDREFQMCTMALTSLGIFHAGLGITAPLMIKFARSALSAIRQANADSPVHYSALDYEMITDAVIAVTQTMTSGIKHHSTKMEFVFREKESMCSCPFWCWQVRKLKHIDKRSYLSIYNLVQMLKEN